MRSAKEIRVAPVAREHADALVKRVHYSRSVVRNSSLHLGVFLDGRLEGAMQFGPSLDKRNVMGLVRDTKWNGFLELNRLAFSERLPRNSESRALAIAFRILRKNYPQIEWVISFADGTSCGDGTIYRASGFVLTGIRKNSTIWIAPDGSRHTNIGLRLRYSKLLGGGSSMRPFRERGFRPAPGFQLRYLYFINPAARDRLTVPVLPFDAIAEAGASMYRGERRTMSGGGADGGASGPPEGGGSNPTPPLHLPDEDDADA